MAGFRRKTRFIVELRYEPVPQFFDVRGRVIGELHPVVKPLLPWWQADSGQILLTDSLERPRDQVVVGSQRTSVVLEDPASLSAFVAHAELVLDHTYGLMGAWWPAIRRLGVRFIEVVKTPHATYEATRSALLHTFHKLPVALPLTYIDSQAILVHERGRYGIGPTKRGDDWTKQVFQDDSKNMPDIGIAVDVDSFSSSFAVKSQADLLAVFHDVLQLSLAVEEGVLRAANVAQ